MDSQVTIKKLQTIKSQNIFKFIQPSHRHSEQSHYQSTKIKLLINDRIFSFYLNSQKQPNPIRIILQNYYQHKKQLTPTFKLDNLVNILGFQQVLQSNIKDKNIAINIMLYYGIIPKCKELLVSPIYMPKFQQKGMKGYKILKLIGRGGFSNVYLVRKKFNGKLYAMKVIQKKDLLQQDKYLIIQNQKNIMLKLQGHPLICKLQQCFQTRRTLVLVLQYYPGGQLFYYLKLHKSFTQDIARFYIIQLLLALQFLHSNLIVYSKQLQLGDIKPENIIIDQNGHIRLGDFGLAKILQRQEEYLAYSFCGSPEYISPEMIKKNGHSMELDFYCVGILLFQLVYGRPPFMCKDKQDLFTQILKGKVQFPSYKIVSDQFKSLISLLLQKNNNKRIGFKRGIKEIIIHPWFGKVDRLFYLKKSGIAPIVPDLSQLNLDIREQKQKQIFLDYQECTQKHRLLQQFDYFRSNQNFIEQSSPSIIQKEISFIQDVIKQTNRENQLPGINFKSITRPIKSRSLPKGKSTPKLNDQKAFEIDVEKLRRVSPSKVTLGKNKKGRIRIVEEKLMRQITSKKVKFFQKKQ